MERLSGLNALLPHVEGDPAAMVALARQLASAGEKASARQLCLNAFEQPACDPESRAWASELLSNDVPRWHFAIVRDRARNDAFEGALRRAISPGCKVLEIGTGTGLLAMMAARAGASQVITCERDPLIAAVAAKVIEQNGYSQSVRVVPKSSLALDVMADLGGPADILVSEIVSNDLLGQGALEAIAHATSTLLKPGAAVIPRHGRIRIALAEYAGAEAPRLEMVSGFDLSPFNCLAKPFREIGIGDKRLELRSSPVDLFSFDFASTMPHARRATVPLVASGGTVNGIAQWIALDMDGSETYENSPAPSAHSCWAAMLHPFDRPIATRPQDRILATGAHDATGLKLWRAQNRANF